MAFRMSLNRNVSVPHITKEKMLQVIRDEVRLTNEEARHLLSCAECLRLYTDLKFPDK